MFPSSFSVSLGGKKVFQNFTLFFPSVPSPPLVLIPLSKSPTQNNTRRIKQRRTGSAGGTAALELIHSISPPLAARVAAKLAAKGWVITSIGNWTHGGITHTSIYVDGHANAAATMRGDFPYATGGVKKPWSQMSQSRITVVLASDYPR